MMDPVLSELLSYGDDRFRLRRLEFTDAPLLFERLTGDPAVTRFLPYRTHQSVKEAALMVARYHALERSRPPAYMLAVLDGSELAGVVGASLLAHSVSISIKFARRSRGAGRAFTAPFARWLLAHSAVWRVWAYCDVDNVAIQRVMERSGATCEGVARRYAVHPNVSPEPRDCKIYSLVRDG